jgi:hypothetical protein
MAEDPTEIQKAKVLVRMWHLLASFIGTLTLSIESVWTQEKIPVQIHSEQDICQQLTPPRTELFPPQDVDCTQVGGVIYFPQHHP